MKIDELETGDILFSGNFFILYCRIFYKILYSM